MRLVVNKLSVSQLTHLSDVETKGKSSETDTMGAETGAWVYGDKMIGADMEGGWVCGQVCGTAPVLLQLEV